MRCDFTLNGEAFGFELEGELEEPAKGILFDHHNQLLRDLPWMDKGYTTFPLFDEAEFPTLRTSIVSILRKLAAEQRVALPATFELEEYHRYFQTDEIHQQIISKTRFLTSADFGIDIPELAARLSARTGKKLSVHNPLLQEEIIILRINRPNSYDINPFHRDGYLDIWKNVLNVWIPVAGCGPQSNLGLIAGSHWWDEKDIVRTKAGGASINGLKYHVPAILSATNGLHAIRSDVQYGEALLFTPFLIHGAALNRTADSTRMSLELRFFIES